MITELPTWLDLIAIASGGLFGSAVAVQRKAPLVGVMLLGVLMALGGGMLRDTLINAPVVALKNELYLPVAIGAAFLGLPLARRITEHPVVGLGLDALSLGLYVVVGTAKASLFGLSFTASVFIGLITAIGGGTLVDILVGERPAVLKHGPWFASAALLGAFVYLALKPFFPGLIAEIATVAVVFTVRFTSERLGYSAPSVETLRKIQKRRK